MTLQQVYNTVKTAELMQANLIEGNRVNLVAGVLNVSWQQIDKIGRFINAVYRQYLLGDATSANFLKCYDCLLGLIVSYGLNTIDPNAQSPGTTIITVPVIQGYHTDKIQFTTTTGSPEYTINYQTDIVPGENQTYAQRYGNNPQLSIVVYTGGFVGDEQTPPNYVYTNNNPAQPLISITYQYPVATTGYLQISGVSGT